MQSMFRWLDEPDENLAAERLQLILFTAALANVGLLHSGILRLQINASWQMCIALLPAMWMGVVAVAWGRPRTGMAVQFLALVTSTAIAYPGIANHAVLQMYIAGLLAVLPARRSDAVWVVGTLRWLFVSVVVMSAVQKTLHGSYWSGAYFGWVLADPSLNKMHWMLRHFASPEEIERLRALRSSGGEGSFIPQSFLLVTMSRVILLLEIAVPALMVALRGRWWPSMLMAVAFAGIAVMSRELTFGCLMLGLIGLSLPVRFGRFVVGLQVLVLVFGSMRQAFYPFTGLN